MSELARSELTRSTGAGCELGQPLLAESHLVSPPLLRENSDFTDSSTFRKDAVVRSLT